jgi:DNA modification methylase
MTEQIVSDWLDKCHFGDCIETMKTMPDGFVQTCVTSPPYFGLRDYGHDGQIGLEPTPDQFIAKLVDVFREVKRVLKDDGTLWLNIGDSYARTGGTDRKVSDSANVGSTRNTLEQIADRKQRAPEGIKPKDLIGIPWLLAFALRADGWYLRQEIIWHKPNPMPESVTDRCTKSHESIFLLAKSGKYYFDNGAIKEDAKNWGTRDRSEFRGGTTDPLLKQHGLAGKEDEDEPTRNKRSVWTVATTPYKGAHFATFPTALIEPCILAGAPAGGIVLDPFFGSGTTGQVAQALGRRFIGCELNPAYKALQDERLCQPSFEFAESA